MNRAGPIFAAIGIGFLLYITMRGNLPKYVALLWTAGPSAAMTANGSGTSSALGGLVQTSGSLFTISPDAFSWASLSTLLSGGGFNHGNDGMPALPALGK